MRCQPRIPRMLTLTLITHRYIAIEAFANSPRLFFALLLILVRLGGTQLTKGIRNCNVLGCSTHALEDLHLLITLLHFLGFSLLIEFQELLLVLVHFLEALKKELRLYSKLTDRSSLTASFRSSFNLNYISFINYECFLQIGQTNRSFLKVFTQLTKTRF